MGRFTFEGVISLERVILNLSVGLAKVINDSTSALEGIQVSLNSAL